MIPAAGWLVTPFGLPPELWPLPEKYEGTYYDPLALYAPLLAGCDPVVPAHTTVKLGDVNEEARVGYAQNGDKTMQVKLQQTGVFGVILFDSLTIAEILEKCFPIPTTCVVEDSDPVLDCSQAGLLVPCTPAMAGATLCTDVGDPGVPACSSVGGTPVPTTFVKPNERLVPNPDQCELPTSSTPYV